MNEKNAEFLVSCQVFLRGSVVTLGELRLMTSVFVKSWLQPCNRQELLDSWFFLLSKLFDSLNAQGFN